MSTGGGKFPRKILFFNNHHINFAPRFKILIKVGKLFNRFLVDLLSSDRLSFSGETGVLL